MEAITTDLRPPEKPSKRSSTSKKVAKVRAKRMKLVGVVYLCCVRLGNRIMWDSDWVKQAY